MSNRLPTIRGDVVIERKPSERVSDCDVVLVRLPDEYVTGIVASDDTNPGEWFWGHYTQTLDAAVEDYNDR